jgi:hypothetical protein
MRRWRAAVGGGGGLVVVVLALARAHPQPAPGTVHGTLARWPTLVGIRADPAFGVVGAQLTHAAGVAQTSAALGSAATATAGAALDATVTLLGPLFLTAPDTLGARGRVHVSLVGQQSTLERFDGARTWQTPDPMIVRDRRTGSLLAVRLRAQLTLHVAAGALAASYGLRDNLDVSLVLPVSHIRLESTLGVRVVRRAEGGRFVPVRRAPLERSSAPIDSVGPGDVTLRVKWKLPRVERTPLSLDVAAIFPTGDAENAHGSGDYFVHVTAAAMRKMWRGRGAVYGNAAISFAVSDVAQSRALYGLGATLELLARPLRVAGVVELLGESQLDPSADADDTAVVTVQPGGEQLGTAPALGLAFGRKDYFDLAVGVRVRFAPWLLGFANVQVALNDAGLRPAGVVPTVGLGAVW